MRQNTFEKILVCKKSDLVCENGGECVNRDGKPACKCTGEFSGEKCEYRNGKMSSETTVKSYY